MANMIPISTVTVGSGGVSAIEFTSIPQNYTDLLIKLSIRSNRSGAVVDGLKMSFNGLPSGTSYSTRYLEGTGSASGSGTLSASSALEAWDINASNSTTNTFSSIDIYIPNYTSSNYKSISTENVAENNATAGYQILAAGLWSSASPIISIHFTSPTSSIWQQYSSATLYGIRKY